jgi:xanthosine utilization system XapX-like protein
VPQIANPSLLIAGLIALVIGIWLYRWSARHDMKGLAVDAAWKAATSLGKTAVTPEIKAKLDAFNADQSTIGRTKQVAGLTIRHFIAQAVGLVSYAVILGGLGLAAAGIWWR